MSKRTRRAAALLGWRRLEARAKVLSARARKGHRTRATQSAARVRVSLSVARQSRALGLPAAEVAAGRLQRARSENVARALLDLFLAPEATRLHGAELEESLARERGILEGRIRRAKKGSAAQRRARRRARALDLRILELSIGTGEEDTGLGHPEEDPRGRLVPPPVRRVIALLFNTDEIESAEAAGYKAIGIYYFNSRIGEEEWRLFLPGEDVYRTMRRAYEQSLGQDLQPIGVFFE